MAKMITTHLLASIAGAMLVYLIFLNIAPRGLQPDTAQSENELADVNATEQIANQQVNQPQNLLTAQKEEIDRLQKQVSQLQEKLLTAPQSETNLISRN